MEPQYPLLTGIRLILALTRAPLMAIWTSLPTLIPIPTWPFLSPQATTALNLVL